MGRANASYIAAVRAALRSDPATGSAVLRRARASGPADPGELEALRLYSRSEYVGQEDGKALNARLMAGRDAPPWAADLDGACGLWSLPVDALLWRGAGLLPLPGIPSASFLSCSLVERVARRFRSRGSGSVAAVLLPAGATFALPAAAWGDGDDARTLAVVRNEAEVVLARGTVLEHVATVDGLAGGAGARQRVRVMRVAMP